MTWARLDVFDRTSGLLEHERRLDPRYRMLFLLMGKRACVLEKQSRCKLGMWILVSAPSELNGPRPWVGK